MKIKEILLLTVLIGFISCQTGQKKSNPETSSGKGQPNILILLADDLGYGDVGTYGSEIQTPSIDKLASEGIKFTNFHVGAACSPTRTMLLTGVDNHRAGVGNLLEIQADNQFDQPGYEGHLNDKVVTVATRLKDAGYHTYMAGKWHLGGQPHTIPYARGFEKSFALMESGGDNWQSISYAPFHETATHFEDSIKVALPKEGYFSSDYYSDKIINYIGSNLQDGKPFFAYLSFQAVHYPHQAPKEFIDKYNGVYDNGWSELRKKRFARQKELGIVSQDANLDTLFAATTYPGWQLPEWEALSEEEKKFNARRMQTYAGMVDNMDYNIGRVINYLKETGQYENTIIVFLSDNGADPNELPLTPGFDKWYKSHYPLTLMKDYNGDYSAMGQKGSFADYGPGWAAAANTPGSYYKTFATEGGMRVPFIVSYPKALEKGKITGEFGFVKDIAPTILEMAGVDANVTTYNGKEIYPVTGVSMWNFLKSGSDKIHAENEMIGYELAGGSAIFQGKYKLMINITPKGSGKWELYDIIADPTELNNLADKMPELVETLKKGYLEYEQQNGVIPVPNDYDMVKQGIKNSTRVHPH